MLSQVSIFAENKKGRLQNITSLLQKENINIWGSITNDSAEYGIIRMVVSNPEHAEKVLAEAGYLCRLTEVLGVELDDEVGALNRLLISLEESNINVDYLYLSFPQNVTVIQLTAISDAVSCAATVPLMSLSEIVITSGIAAVKESLKTFARNVAYRTIRMTGVIIDVNNIPLSLKNSFLFLFINANTVLINAHLQASSL